MDNKRKRVAGQCSLSGKPGNADGPPPLLDQMAGDHGSLTGNRINDDPAHLLFDNAAGKGQADGNRAKLRRYLVR